MAERRARTIWARAINYSPKFHIIFTMNIRHKLQALATVCCFVVPLYAQKTDSLKSIQLQELSVTGNTIQKSALPTQPSVLISGDEIIKHQGHSLMDALSHTEGVQAMDIGVGFSKPMIRGLGFQRIAVTENGVKQEGQQWGADHGLEIDAYHVESVRVIKGPASVIYGSDAMGGAVEILPSPFPRTDTISGEALISHQSVSSGLNGSFMLQVKRNRFFAKVRYTERHWADYKVPADSFTYLSMRLPIHNKRLKNTAGMERSANALFAYKYGNFQGRINLSDSYQKSGFFSGAHGLPNSSSLNDDGNHWNVDLPYSLVNHLKIVSTNTWSNSQLQTKLILGYQVNHREEWSIFHSHNPNQMPPEKDPDKELMFHLQTANTQLQFRFTPTTSWKFHGGISAMVQHNGIDGYGFLIPAYRRWDCGTYVLADYRHSSMLQFNGSIRYDIGHIHTNAHGEDVEVVDRNFNDYSMALGMEYKPNPRHTFTASIGRAFRLPSANELTSNGVHHGAFRHEMGDKSLSSEQGWQMDLSYSLCLGICDISISPFYSYYPHYIALQPTGQWSMLPDAGQVYRYTDAPTTLAGGELHIKARLWRNMHYTFAGEYVHTYDHSSHTATSFSPPATMRNTISWDAAVWQCFMECQSVAPQNRVCHNEDKTSGYNLFHIGGSVDFQFSKSKLSLLLHISNLFDTSYLNHLNFYRRIELPEAGIDIQSTIRLTF